MTPELHPGDKVKLLPGSENDDAREYIGGEGPFTVFGVRGALINLSGESGEWRASRFTLVSRPIENQPEAKVGARVWVPAQQRYSTITSSHASGGAWIAGTGLRDRPEFIVLPDTEEPVVEGEAPAAEPDAVKTERDRCLLAVAEQRCERGTAWDAAIVAAMNAIKPGSAVFVEKPKPTPDLGSFRQAVEDALHDFDLVADGTPEDEYGPRVDATKEELSDALKTFVIAIRYALTNSTPTPALSTALSVLEAAGYTVTEPVKVERAWLNIDKDACGTLYPSRERADNNASSWRIACIEVEYRPGGGLPAKGERP